MIPEPVERPNGLSIADGLLGSLHHNIREEQLRDVTALANLLTSGQVALPSADQHTSATQYVNELAQAGKWPAGIDLPMNPADNPWVLGLDMDPSTAQDGAPLLLAIPRPNGKSLAAILENAVKHGPEEIVVACINRPPEIIASKAFLERLTPEQQQRPMLVP